MSDWREDRKRYPLMLQERADLLREGRDLLATAEMEGRELTADERRRDDQIQSRLLQLSTAITEEQIKREAMRLEPAVPNPNDISQLARPSTPGSGPAVSAKFAAMFGPVAGQRGGFTSFAEFAAQVHNGLYSPELQAAALGTPGDGSGFLIPTEFSAQLLDASLEDEIVRPRAMPFPMVSDTRVIAGFSHTDGSAGAAYGGIQGGWTKPGAQIGEGKPTIKARELHANKLALLTELLNEMLADGPGIDAMLRAALVKSFGWHLDTAFFTGSGTGEPLGILKSPALVTVPKESGQAAGTIVAANAAKMYSRMAPASIKNAAWVLNSTALPQLLTATLAGDTIPLVNQGEGGTFTMLGRPLLLTEKLPMLGQVGDIVFADFSQYAVGMRKEVTIEQSIHVGFKTDTTWYRTTLRADGFPLWEEPYTPLNGATVSPFVALEAR